MKIKISNLSDGVHEFNFENSVEELDIPEPYFGNVTTNVSVSKFGEQLFLNCEIEITANLLCDRCNTEFQSSVNSNYKMVYLVGEPVNDSERIDVTYIRPDADKIIIDKDVRDYALLALPMKNLCRDDCKGLCYKCGSNLNEADCKCVHDEIDARWEPLLKLKKK